MKKVVHTFQYRIQRRPLLFSFAFVTFIICAILYVSAIPQARASFALATSISPVTFTELYFQNPTNLPSEVSLNTDYSFAFSLHNVENRTVSYPYTVYSMDAYGKKEIIRDGVITLLNNNKGTVRVTFKVTKPVTREEIITSLTTLNQQIDFWVSGASLPVPQRTTLTNATHSNKTEASPTPTPTPTPQLQYGGWYPNASENKVMVWLGVNSQGQDVWSNTFPK